MQIASRGDISRGVLYLTEPSEEEKERGANRGVLYDLHRISAALYKVYPRMAYFGQFCFYTFTFNRILASDLLLIPKRCAHPNLKTESIILLV